MPKHTSCPITDRPFVREIQHPSLGLVATYGGPRYCRTEPIFFEHDGQLRCEVFDTTEGRWLIDGERLGIYMTVRRPRETEIPALARYRRYRLAPEPWAQGNN